MLGNIAEYLGVTLQEIYDASVEDENQDKLIKILGAVVILGLLSGAAFTILNHKTRSNYEIVEKYKYYDTSTYESYNDLYASSKYVILGEITETKQEMLSELYNDPINVGKIVVDKVYKGELDENSCIELCQNYYFDDTNKQLVTISMATPMKEGEQWLFFIEEDLSGNLWLTGDCLGRYPLPEQFEESTISQLKGYSDADKNELLSKVTKEQFGVYKTDAINLSLYSQILNNLNIQ